MLTKFMQTSVIAAALVFMFFQVKANVWPKQTLADTHGVNVSKISQLVAAKREATVVVAVSTHCGHCEKSIPFYRSLQAQLKGKARLVALFPQGPEEVKQWLTTNGLKDFQPYSKVKFNELGIAGTPTLIVTGWRIGYARKLEVGEIPAPVQKELLQSLKAS